MSSGSFDGKKEVMGILLFFLGIAMMLMFYLPAEFTGTVGAFIKNTGFGLVGIMAYGLPVLLVYMGIDYFIEKRAGVSKIRVRSVLTLLVCVSAFLAIVSMDFEHFESLCVDEHGYSVATKAIALLWDSGLDSSLITPQAASANVISGGLLGGGIAIALRTILGNLISCITIVVFIIAQLILVFHVSIKKSAKKTAQAIKSGTSRMYQNVNRSRNEHQVYSGNGYTEFAPTTPAASPFVNYPTQNQYQQPQQAPQPVQPVYPQQTGTKKVRPKKDPFYAKMPVDGESGFIDVSDKEFGADTQPHPDRLKYGEKSYRVPEEENRADFSYTPMPKNPPLHKKGKMDVPSFLDNRQQDFYDLSDGNTPAAPDDTMPYEVSSYTSTTIRRPSVDTEAFGELEDDIPAVVPVQQMTTPAAAPVPSSVSATADDPSSRITINKKTENAGYSATEGRIVDTGKVRTETPIDVPPSGRAPAKKLNGVYKPAPAKLLSSDEKTSSTANTNAELKAKAEKLEGALKSFGIDAQVVNITHGPSITRFELTLATGTKVNRVLSLQDDIQLAMAAFSVRIEAPIPGKSAIGIEIPNDKTTAVHLRGLLEDPKFRESTPLTVALGRDIPGKPIYCDLAKMPHLMIAGQTGSGKSVCINTILCSILCKSSPDQVRLIMVDPKVVELSIYNGIPHLIMPVETDAKKVSNILKWAVVEMERRYKLFSQNDVRNLDGYNEFLKYNDEKPLPLILIIIDELADLMTVAGKDVETQISRLAAKARAAGIHLIIATQRPSVDVITGVIKANLPSRIAFSVASGVDSRTILDQVGAEKLLGKGDMLYYPGTAPKPIRGQGAFVSDKEVETIVNYLKNTYGAMYDNEIIDKVNQGVVSEESGGGEDGKSSSGFGGDDLFEQAVEVVLEVGQASSSVLQRRLGVGYPRASRLIDLLEKNGIIGPFEGSKPRKVLITEIDWLEMKAKGGK